DCSAMSASAPHYDRSDRAMLTHELPATPPSAPRMSLPFFGAGWRSATAQNLQRHAAARRPLATRAGTFSPILRRVSPRPWLLSFLSLSLLRTHGFCQHESLHNRVPLES